MRQEYIFYAPRHHLVNGAAMPHEESTHFLKSLRGRSGDILNITDGCGRLYSASAQVEKSSVVLLDLTLIEETVEDNLPSLAVGLLKHTDRVEWLVEKAVEIGVKEIVWLLTERSTRYGYRHERIERIAISAMKQSGRLRLPRIVAPIELAPWIQQCNSANKFIGYCGLDTRKTSLASVMEPNLSTALLIGPEPDFSESEIRLAIQHGFRPVSLGQSRLRSETAAMYALTIFSGLGS